MYRGVQFEPVASLVMRQFRSEWPHGPRVDDRCSWCAQAIDHEKLLAKEDGGIGITEYMLWGGCLDCQKVANVPGRKVDADLLAAYMADMES